MKNYGFVYIWFDKKYKRYYIGSHWGQETDKYICSSRWMYNAHYRRPQDFKRRIICKVYTNKIDLLDEEFYWLSMISDEEIISKKYYNRTKHRNGHWTEKDYEKNIKKRISIAVKEAFKRPEVKLKHKQAMNDRNYKATDEIKKKMSDSMKKTMAEKYPVENRWKKFTPEERTQYYSEKGKRQWANMSEENKIKFGKKSSKNSKRLHQDGKIGMIGKKHSEESKKKMSEWHMGKMVSLETKEKLSKALTGKKRSDEFKLKHSKSIKEVWEKRRAGLLSMPNHSK